LKDNGTITMIGAIRKKNTTQQIPRNT